MLSVAHIMNYSV